MFDEKKLEENGTIDYWLDLKKFVNEYVETKYPLTKDDMRSILKDDFSENVKNRNMAIEILMEALEEELKKVEKGEYKSGSVSEYNQSLFKIKQNMLAKLRSVMSIDQKTDNKVPENRDEK